MDDDFNCNENLEIEIVNFESQKPRKLKHKWITGVSKNNNFMFELVKAERDKCLIETIKECALHPDRPIEITKQIIKLTEQELEEVFDKVNMSEENRTIYRDIYFKNNSRLDKEINQIVREE